MYVRVRVSHLSWRKFTEEILLLGESESTAEAWVAEGTAQAVAEAETVAEAEARLTPGAVTPAAAPGVVAPAAAEAGLAPAAAEAGLAPAATPAVVAPATAEAGLAPAAEVASPALALQQKPASVDVRVQSSEKTTQSLQIAQCIFHMSFPAQISLKFMLFSTSATEVRSCKISCTKT